MWSLLDTIGASVLGGTVILLVISISLQMNSFSNELILNNIVQTNTSETTEILKYDFYKIGYGASSDKVIKADSTELKFLADINNSGSVDTIYYYYSNVNVDSGQTSNPNHFLYRQKNSTTPLIYALAADFKLTYYDSLGQTLTYAGLQSGTTRDKIRSIRVFMTLSSESLIDSLYQQADWTTVIRPKNLR